VIPAGLAPLLGPLAAPLARLGVEFADGSGTLLVGAYAWIAALPAVVTLMPNSCELLERWAPVLEAPDQPRTDRAWGPLTMWQPSRRWAVTMAAIAVLGVLSIARGGEFLYWQF
jgi:alginate O-acetyltransferase complex protein AlgI